MRESTRYWKLGKEKMQHSVYVLAHVFRWEEMSDLISFTFLPSCLIHGTLSRHFSWNLPCDHSCMTFVSMVLWTYPVWFSTVRNVLILTQSWRVWCWNLSFSSGAHVLRATFPVVGCVHAHVSARVSVCAECGWKRAQHLHFRCTWYLIFLQCFWALKAVLQGVVKT